MACVGELIYNNQQAIKNPKFSRTSGFNMVPDPASNSYIKPLIYMDFMQGNTYQ